MSLFQTLPTVLGLALGAGASFLAGIFSAALPPHLFRPYLPVASLSLYWI